MNNIDPIDRNHLIRDLQAESFTTYEEEVPMLYLDSTIATINAQKSLFKGHENYLNDVEWAWTIIANANEGNWPSSGEWREAAERFRDHYHDILREHYHDILRETGETVGETVGETENESQ